MPATSREPLRVPYEVDATAWPVEIAIVPITAGEPADADYHAAAWEGLEATLLIGAGTAVDLAVGEYMVWTRITTPTQRPVRRSGSLTIGPPAT
jgi:hypothetical protein